MCKASALTGLAFAALIGTISACSGSTPAPAAAPTVTGPTTAPSVAAARTIAPPIAPAPTVSAPTAALPTIAAPSATAATAAAPTAAGPSGSGPTAGQLADQGKAVFAGHCAKCHGDQGQGVTAPANIGPNANLGKYNTAQGLYTYVSTNMPQDAPGSLTPQEYLQVTSFLLLQNNFVSPQTPISTSTLDTISLTK